MKFIADGMLGGLARWLRFIGYDTLYFNTSRKIDFIRQAKKEGRIVLTKDRKLCRDFPGLVYFVNGENTLEQLKDVIKNFKIRIKEKDIFSLCSICNKKLERIEKEKIKGQIPEYIYLTKEKFSICPDCGRIYWDGDHCKRIKKVIKEI